MSKASTKLLIYLGLLLAAYLAYRQFFANKSPNELTLAIQTIEQAGRGKNPVDPSALLKSFSLDDATMSPWINLMLANVSESLGQTKQAIAAYQKVSSDSAASLEAELALFRLDKTLRNGEKINALEKKLKLLERFKLLKELDFIKAQISEEKGNYLLALNTYQSLRTQKTNLDIRKQARLRLKKLLRNAALRPLKTTPAFLVNEVDALTSEANYSKAFEVIEKLKNEASKKDRSYFELLLKEEDLLRKQSKNIEADKLLLSISADGDLNTADKAALKIAKNAWNIDDNERALDFLEKFDERLKDSKLRDEANYIRARIVEELDQNRAIQIYQSLSEKQNTWGEKSLKRLAWIYLTKNDLENASLWFKKLSEISEQKDHALYWLSYIDKKAESIEDARLLTAMLAAEFKYSYYNKEISLDRSDAKENEATCKEEIPVLLKERLQKLAQIGLRHYAGYEIDYYFLVESQSQGDKIKETYNRAIYQVNYGFPQIATRIGLKALRSNDKGDSACDKALLLLSYPVVFEENYKNAKNASAVDAALLLAITHTESHFNPIAQSPKNATGLMQILPSTAKQLGLKYTENLFDPETNIRLGAKYFSQLLSRFNNNKIYAIAAYNAGPTAVDRWIKKYPELESEMWIEMIPYPETNDYVKKVLKAERIYSELLK